MEIVKPNFSDIDSIRKIMAFWTEPEEVDKYADRLKEEINGKTEFNMQFWVAKESGKVEGIVGLSDPLPQVLTFAKTQNPAEIKILYVDKDTQGKGVGKALITFIEGEAKNQQFNELLVRSGERYRCTAYGFYEKMGYTKVGVLGKDNESKKMQVFEKIL